MRKENGVKINNGETLSDGERLNNGEKINNGEKNKQWRKKTRTSALHHFINSSLLFLPLFK